MLHVELCCLLAVLAGLRLASVAEYLQVLMERSTRTRVPDNATLKMSTDSVQYLIG